jgi:hypothetical protein
MPLLFVLTGLPGPLAAPLAPVERFGRASLFVYWIHVELVYGYATWPLHRSLELWQVGAAWLGFTALMYGAVALRDRFSKVGRIGRVWPAIRRTAAI